MLQHIIGEIRTGLVVASHPDANSFNHALAWQVVRCWRDCGVDTHFLDLHASGFDPVLDTSESRGLPTDDAEIQREIGRLMAADAVAIVHPNCWGAPPAMMKGWMDRVFAPGAAYAFAKGEDDGSAPVGLLNGKRALVLNTSNTTFDRERLAFGDPLERIWRDCLLGYCGFSRVERLVFRVVATSTPDERESWLGVARDSARALLLA